MIVIAVLNRLPIKLLPQRGAGRRHATVQTQVGGHPVGSSVAWQPRSAVATARHAYRLHITNQPSHGATAPSTACSLARLLTRLNTPVQSPVMFDDVAGVDEAKEELKEIVVGGRLC